MGSSPWITTVRSLRRTVIPSGSQTAVKDCLLSASRRASARTARYLNPVMRVAYRARSATSSNRVRAAHASPVGAH